MDIRQSSTYFAGMMHRLVTMFAILAITLVTTVAAAHAARMSSGSGADRASHVAGMEHAAMIADRACDAGQHCGAADAGMCELVCAGLSASLTAPTGDVAQSCGPARHDFPSQARHASRAPGLNDRPPRPCLL